MMEVNVVAFKRCVVLISDATKANLLLCVLVGLQVILLTTAPFSQL